jgi:FkbM family methyltransferase
MRNNEFRRLLSALELPFDGQFLRVLRHGGAPIVMYGASDDVAGQIQKTLAKNGVKVDMIMYDEETPVSIQVLTDVEKIHLRDIDKKYKGYHVVIGFVKGYGKVEELKSKLKWALTVSYLSEIFGMETIDQSFVWDNLEFMEDFFTHLGDRRSQESFMAYMYSKLIQDMRFLPPVFDKAQYFPQGFFELSNQESFVDCGAFEGDTIADFLKVVGGDYRRIWAFEPDRANFKKLTQYIENCHVSNIEALNKGVYSHVGKLPFQEEGSMLSMLTDESDCYIEVDTIDRVTAGDPVTFIKMDVEGAELQVLKGAEQTIREHKPILAVPVYHKRSDLIDIPKYIKEIVPEYTFYFRVHKKLAIDTVLYAVVKSIK